MSKYKRGTNQYKVKRVNKFKYWINEFAIGCTKGMVWAFVIFIIIGVLKFEWENHHQILIPEAHAEAVQKKDIPPVLARIADCESGARTKSGKAVKGSATHYGKSGQVLMVGNNNKTVDVGRYAINSVWYKKASDMNLDLTKEKDNEKFAVWIYENRGTDDWSASRSCWSI